MKRGDIVLVNLPSPTGHTGHEQIGSRPALIVHNDVTCQTLSVIMIIPFTSQLSAQRFPHTIPVSPSPTNGLNQPSLLMVSQLRAIDKQRLAKTIGHLENHTMELVDAEIKSLLGL